MKKIDFGFNNDRRLNSSFSGIEPYNGEYLDVTCCEDTNLLITRIVDSQQGLDGNIDVREVIQDYYSDGSYVTYANMEKNVICLKIQQLLNTERLKKRINKGESAREILLDEGLPAYASFLNVEPKNSVVPGAVTSIKPEMFKQLKDSKKYYRGKSMYDLTVELKKLHAEINNLSKEQNQRHM